MKDLALIRTVLMSMYKCEGVDCHAIYAVEEDKTEEPICAACGCEYFSFVALQTVEY
jgi:hypothetical protein